MFVVFGGTANVGTGWGKSGPTGTSLLPFEGREGPTSGLLVGVNDGTGVLVGDAVKVGGTSGSTSVAGLDVSCTLTFGVFVKGSARVGSFVTGISVAVSVDKTATAVAMVVGDGSGIGGPEFAKLLTAKMAIRINPETRIKTATIREAE